MLNRLKDGGTADPLDQARVFILTLEEAQALYRALEKQYVDFENTLAIKVVYDSQRFVSGAVSPTITPNGP
jgi:hypothetical protein